MSMIHPRPNQARIPLGGLVYIAISAVLALYFTFAAVQGDFGVFRRVQIDAEAQSLRAERDGLRTQLAQMENLTKRLSDSYLDMDLLDQQARSMLGYLRADEVVVR